MKQNDVISHFFFWKYKKRIFFCLYLNEKKKWENLRSSDKDFGNIKKSSTLCIFKFKKQELDKRNIHWILRSATSLYNTLYTFCSILSFFYIFLKHFFFLFSFHCVCMVQENVRMTSKKKVFLFVKLLWNEVFNCRFF